MDSIEEIAINEKKTTIAETSQQTTDGMNETRKKLPPGFYARASRYGMLAGAFMAAYLLLINISGFDTSPALKLTKHIILLTVLGISLYYVKRHMPDFKLFGTGMRMGVMVTIVSAITLVVLNILTYSIGDVVILQSFASGVESWRGLFVLQVAVFFEVLVFGGILTLCWLQYLKRPLK